MDYEAANLRGAVVGVLGSQRHPEYQEGLHHANGRTGEGCEVLASNCTSAATITLKKFNGSAHPLAARPIEYSDE
jgi:hypothetical protein